MPKFLDKDFFGDPIWPSDFASDSKKFQDQEYIHHSLIKNSPYHQEPNQNSWSSISFHFEHQGADEFENTFMANEQKILYSNFKHSEITYLDDHNKGIEFSKDDLSNSQRLSESQISEDSHDKNLKRQAKIQFEKQLFSLPDLFESSSQRNESDYQINSETEQEQEQEVKRQNVPNRRSSNIFSRNYCPQTSRLKTEPEKQKLQQKMITQIVNQQLNWKKKKQRKKIMRRIESRILKKLQTISQQDDNDSDIKRPTRRKVQKKNKTHKYKILTSSQKQYLVYLSTITTTCQVARRFHISVNNICRWKKGTKRKVGAGRKIVNQELEQKIISYVKSLMQDGKCISRKQIQLKAKELSEDESFKASKGWFQRFYNRNIGIFTTQTNNENN